MGNKYVFTGNGMEKQKIKDDIDRWMGSKELLEIVLAFAGRMPSNISLEEKAEWLVHFSDRWDYRKKQKVQNVKCKEHARWEIKNTDITEEQKRIVEKNIAALGLIGIERPCENYFDYIIALGGARFSCLYRPQYVDYLLKEGGVCAKNIILLSGMREILESEREMTDTYAPEARTEYDLINAGAERVFQLDGEYIEERYHNKNSNLNWATRKYEYLDNQSLFSFSGPSSEPKTRRANSSDTFQFFVEKMDVKTNSKLLLVTSQIYVPYQQMEAIRTLAVPYGVYVETVGFPTEWSGKLQGMMESVNYLQEIRSTLQAINRYLSQNVLSV